MAATLVLPERTKFSQSEMIKGFTLGWIKLLQNIPKKESIAVLFAQNGHETGGTVSMWNRNIGNYKYVPSTNDNELKYMMLSNVWERNSKGEKIIYQPPNPATWFRAFDSLEDGISFHIDKLKNKKYKVAWSAIEKGSVKDFAHLLKINRYYTDTEENYVKGMIFYFNKFMKDLTFEQTINDVKNNQIKIFEKSISTINSLI